VQDLPGYEEALCTLLGTIEARVKAAQQFLTRVEQVVADGSAGPGVPSLRQPLPAQEPYAAPPRREEPQRSPEPVRSPDPSPAFGVSSDWNT
ncbi:unnamed protein product, partial [Polarella glacialis]